MWQRLCGGQALGPCDAHGARSAGGASAHRGHHPPGWASRAGHIRPAASPCLCRSNFPRDVTPDGIGSSAAHLLGGDADVLEEVPLWKEGRVTCQAVAQKVLEIRGVTLT